MKVKRNPLFRIKYEQNNPTVSGRLSRGVYEKPKNIRETEGLSFTDVLKIGLGIIEPKAKDYDRIRNEEYTESWDHSHRDAEIAYIISQYTLDTTSI